MPLFDLPVLPPRQADVQAGRAEFAELEDVRAGRSSGTPRMSPMTVTGSCEQYRSTTSTGAGIVVEVVEKRVGGVLNAVAQCCDGSGGEHR